GPPEFPQHTPGPVPNNFSQPPRLPLQDQWRAPPPPQERDPFFLGEFSFSECNQTTNAADAANCSKK
ncbi:RNA-binding protein 33, partial [Camelus dromedarius]